MYAKGHLQKHAEEILKEIGIQESQRVLDCCCGSGTYTIAAAQLVGEKGLVYAIDTNSEKLNDLRQRINSRKLQNIEIIEEDVELKIPLQDSFIDIVLLYDIFWYFRPAENKLAALLREVYRAAKPNALISVYPAHLDLDELKNFKNEMGNKGFSLENEYSRQLVHEGRIEKGKLLNFKKIENYQVKKVDTHGHSPWVSTVETKLIKNLKWAARKNHTERIVLHSFTHLSQSKASSEITKQLLDNSEQRLKKADYEVYQTPFGYFLDLDVKAPGYPLARLFKDI